MSGRFWIEPPEEWVGGPIDPWSMGPYVCYVLAKDLDDARQTYVAYRDCSDELGIAFICSGIVSGSLERAEDAAVLAQMEGKPLTIYRVVGSVD